MGIIRRTIPYSRISSLADSYHQAEISFSRSNAYGPESYPVPLLKGRSNRESLPEQPVADPESLFSEHSADD
jgi:hypothetical protein